MMASTEVDETAHVSWFDYGKQSAVSLPLTTTGQLWYTFGRGITHCQERVAWQLQPYISLTQCTITAHYLLDGTCAWVLRRIGRNPALVRIP